MGVNRQEGEQLGTQPEGTDATPTEDSYTATVTNTETGGEQQFSDVVSGSDAPTKGPDPAVWGDDEDRPKPGSASSGATGMEIGEVREDEEGNVTKGPGEEWRQGDEGEYINR